MPTDSNHDGSAAAATVSVIIPTFRREDILVATVKALKDRLQEGDEIIVVDQTPQHEPATATALAELALTGAVRWVRKSRPSQCEAMNVGAHLARGRYLLFLDDDIIPSEGLLSGHRAALTSTPEPVATTGQVLQPWNAVPVTQVRDYGLRFDFAYDRPCEVLSLMAGNLAISRTLFLEIGGMDENFRGNNYRNDAELAHRIHRRTGRKIRFVPEASFRHLLAGGGNRAFGAKDTWGAIGGSIGDYYFAMRSLPPARAAAHILRRLVRAPVTRYTVRRPWLVPWLALREATALVAACHRATMRRSNFARKPAAYGDVEPEDPPATNASVAIVS